MANVLLKAETTATKRSIARGRGPGGTRPVVRPAARDAGRLAPARRLGAAQTRCHHHLCPCANYIFEDRMRTSLNFKCGLADTDQCAERIINALAARRDAESLQNGIIKGLAVGLIQLVGHLQDIAGLDGGEGGADARVLG